MRLSEVQLGGVSYPAAFTLRVAMETAERYGDVDAVLEPDLPTAAALERKAWILAAMLRAGQKAAKATGAETPEPPTADDLLDGYVVAEVKQINQAILTVMAADSKTNVETVELGPDEKNAAATPVP